MENNAGLLYAEGFCEWIAAKFLQPSTSPTRSPFEVWSLPAFNSGDDSCKLVSHTSSHPKDMLSLQRCSC